MFYYFFYNSLKNLQEKSLVELLFRRLIGLLISIVFLTNLINIIFFYYKNLLINLNLISEGIFIYFFLFLFVYFLFVLINFFIILREFPNPKIKENIL